MSTLSCDLSFLNGGTLWYKKSTNKDFYPRYSVTNFIGKLSQEGVRICYHVLYVLQKMIDFKP